MTLTRETRDAIGRTVSKLRALFEREFGQQARGRFGLHMEERGEPNTVLPAKLHRHVEPDGALSLAPQQRWQRRELIGALEYLVRDGATGGQAVERLLREASFTAVNRLLAIRVAEAIGVFPEVIGQGRRSAGYREIVGDLFPVLATAEDDGFWTYLEVCGDELGASVPLLFDRRSPVAAFVPSRSCVDDALALINDSSVATAWGEPEALGWAYQFFNTENERKEMRASPAPRDSRELAVRNQFFTPRYVVDWLVQNTLGRRLRQAGYELDLPLLEGDAFPNGQALALEEVRVLDPAVGSGHFLLGCYDLLERAWQLRGVNPERAAERILPCLRGVDIDPRASQVAQTVLLLRGRRSAPRAALTPPVIVTARPMPRSRQVGTDVLSTGRADVLALVGDLVDALGNASDLGTLLKVDQRLATGLDATWAQPLLSSSPASDIGLLEEEILQELQTMVASADATPAMRMFAADAADAVRFVEVSRARYDAVLMNPPFGDAIPETRDYLRAAYGDAAVDIYAAFVARGVELLCPGGYLGAITSRSGFFLTTFSGWRSECVLPRLLATLDLGLGVMHDAMVEAAAYVLSRASHHGKATFRRLLDDKDKDWAVRARDDNKRYERHPDDFRVIPGSPAAYWLAPTLLKMFSSFRPLGARIDIRQGLATADDFRFVRLWWEVPAAHVGRDRRWVPFAKGGDYSPYYADLHLVLDWEDEGRRIREFTRSKGQSESRRVTSSSHYFRPGLTWSRRSQKGFSVRPVPSGAVFGDKGPMLFVPNDDPRALERLMAYLNSGLVAAMLEATVAFGSYEVGAVQRLPAVDVDDEAGRLAHTLTTARQAYAACDETDHLFVSPWLAFDTPGGRRDVVPLSSSADVAVLNSLRESEAVVPLSATYPTRWFAEDHQPPMAPSAEDELSYLMGIVLGRWDLRIVTGNLDPPPIPDPFDPLPSTSRGMIVDGSGQPAWAAPLGYPIELPSNGILHDDPGHPLDVVAAVEHAAGLIAGAASGPSHLRFLSELPDLRRHLRTRFLAGHVRRYSASRRAAPIYWHLTVPTLAWGLWVYAPRLDREGLFAIAQAAQDKRQRLVSHAQQLRQSLSDADRRQRERLESVEALAGEVEVFGEHASRIAQSGWQPDLDDGAVLCAAPLEPLFRERSWLQQVTRYRRDLEKGSYPWATVQRTYFRSDR